MDILNLCQVLVLQNIFRKTELCRTEYLEGTAVARVWFGVPGGYCRGMEKWSCVIDRVYLGANKRSIPLPKRFLLKILFLKTFFNKDI
jgi:hypothetical protein